MGNHTVVALKQPWVTIFTSIMSAFMIGGFVFAWNVNAQVTGLEKLDEAKLPERMAIIETKLEILQDGQRDINRKLDIIIEQPKEKDNGDSRTRNTGR